MKKFNFKSMFVACAALAAIACSEEEGVVAIDNSITIAADSITTWTGEVTIENPIVVADGGTLVIEAGAVITAANNGKNIYIAVAQGGTITATGTADEPIILTSEKKSAGAWSGVHLCGYAPVNSGINYSQVGGLLYGGQPEKFWDVSGTLQYVVVEYAGKNSSSAFGFYGVGYSTVIDHCVAYKSAADGFKWCGGNANASYLVSVGNQDNLFEWTEGWLGCGQFWIGDQIANGGANTIFGENSASNPTEVYVSEPTIANVTMIGDNTSSSTSNILIANGSYVNLYNSLVSGNTTDLEITSAETDAYLVAVDSTVVDSVVVYDIDCILGVYLSGAFSNTVASAAYNQAAFEAVGNVCGTTASYPYDLTMKTTAPALGEVNAYTFIDAAYAGAYSAVYQQDWNIEGTAWGAIVEGYLAE